LPLLKFQPSYLA